MFYPQLEHQQQQSGAESKYEGTQSARPSEKNADVSESNVDSPELNVEASGCRKKGVEYKHIDAKEKE